MTTPEIEYKRAKKRMTQEQRERLAAAERTAELLDWTLSFFPALYGVGKAGWAVIPRGATLHGSPFCSASIDEMWEWIADAYDDEQADACDDGLMGQS